MVLLRLVVAFTGVPSCSVLLLDGTVVKAALELLPACMEEFCAGVIGD